MFNQDKISKLDDQYYFAGIMFYDILAFSIDRPSHCQMMLNYSCTLHEFIRRCFSRGYSTG